MTTAVKDVRGFDYAWHEVALISGWLSRDEAFALYREAIRTPEDGLIVEIGAYRGRSTTLLGYTGREVVTVDPLVPGNYDAEHMLVSHVDARELSARVAKFPNVTWMRQKSTDYMPTRAVSMVYIDGKHSDGQPSRDFWHMMGFMAPKCSVAFHDFTTRVEVQQAVQEAERLAGMVRVGVYGSLYIGRVAS